ncbi:hypothetical protein HOD38_02210 [archaeon]|nr:hypothetical protein [archaeon]MBT4397055.1 hypothetical protein [archaeon]MBT4441053.1 hypothetical protein [archaeon]
MVRIDPKTKQILDKYGSKLADNYQSAMDAPSRGTFTKDYSTFRDEAVFQKNTFYERACKFAGSIINLAPSKEEQKRKLAESIEVAHLSITPAQAYTLSILVMFGFILLALMIGFITFAFGSFSFMLVIILMGMGVFSLIPLSSMPHHLAQKHRLQSSNQMVLCILYIVIYMRHTSNLEHAIKFAGEHIGNPLALDLRKIYWDAETNKYSTIQESLTHYLEGWKDHNLAFVESFHLIQSSLYEGVNKRRLELLDKSLDVILEGTYESMLHFAQDVRSPITMLHMLGVILPILGLIVLPLIGSFLGVSWFSLMMVYNVLLPIAVYYYGYSLLSKRPVGYNQTNLAEENPEYQKLRFLQLKTKTGEILINPKHIAIFIILIGVILAFSPLILHFLDPAFEINFGANAKFLDYRTTEANTIVGPFGLGATLFSLILPLTLGVGLGLYYSIRSKKLIKIRQETNKLETEFRGAIFQLGNRLGGGMPAEMAFGKVAENLHGTPTGKFFTIINSNMRRLGMNLKDAIFSEKNGALLVFPSSLIESTMKVLVESAQKGPQVVSRAMVSIAQYLDRIYKVAERLRDLLAEISSSMKSQVSFLTPLIAGIVVGIGAMITTVIATLTSSLSVVGGGDDGGGLMGGGAGDLAAIFPMANLIPPFFLQLVVGLYVIEMIFVLSILSNAIENGVDQLNEEYTLGKNLYRSSILYVIIAGITILIFTILAGSVAQI